MKKFKICLVFLCLLSIRALGMPQFDGATSFMREIIVKSKTYGDRIAFVDDEDFEMVSKYKWRVKVHKNTIYATTGVETMHMHRMILNPPKGKVVDHIDANGLNNCRKNIRICTQIENVWNNRKHERNKLGVKGVSKSRNGFVAQMSIDGKNTNLGRYETIEQASTAYNNAVIKHRGNFYIK